MLLCAWRLAPIGRPWPEPIGLLPQSPMLQIAGVHMEHLGLLSQSLWRLGESQLGSISWNGLPIWWRWEGPPLCWLRWCLSSPRVAPSTAGHGARYPSWFTNTPLVVNSCGSPRALAFNAWCWNPKKCLATSTPSCWDKLSSLVSELTSWSSELPARWGPHLRTPQHCRTSSRNFWRHAPPKEVFRSLQASPAR